MINNIFKTIGMVFAFMIFIAVVVLAMYISYIAAIGAIMLLLGYVIYQFNSVKDS